MFDETGRKENRKNYLKIGVTAFLVIAASILLIFMFVNKEDFSEAISRLKSAFAPIIYGVVLAYLMNPLMSFFENHLKNFFFKHAKKITRAKKAARVISIILTFVVLVVVISLIIYMFIPEIADTVERLKTILPEQINNLIDWFNGILKEDSTFSDVATEAVEKTTTYVENFINNDLINNATDILSVLASGVWSVFNVIYNIVIGLIFSVYFLFGKEKLSCQMKKILYAFFSRKKANNILRISKKCHGKFTGAITGKIVDSIIVGLICFLGMVIMDLPYKLLISVIVGVTNVIPFFGPFIGAIPSAFLLLCDNPWYCLYFVIFIIILQQIDSNLLTPKIVGDSIGLSAVWVLFGCVVFGSLWGLLGMLLGVPLTACIYMIIKEIVEYRLKKKGLHTETDDYLGVDRVNEQEVILVEPSNEPEPITEEEYDEMIRIENENYIGDQRETATFDKKQKKKGNEEER